MKRWLELQARLEEAILAFGILSIAALMIANVLTRSLLGFSLTFGEELSQFLIVMVCFVGLSYAASQRRHIRMTAFFERLPPRPARLLATVVAASTSLLLLLLAVLALHYAWVVADLGSVSPVLGVPLFLVYLTAPLGFLASAGHYAGEARRLRQGSEDPRLAALQGPTPDERDERSDAP